MTRAEELIYAASFVGDGGPAQAHDAVVRFRLQLEQAKTRLRIHSMTRVDQMFIEFAAAGERTASQPCPKCDAMARKDGLCLNCGGPVE